MNYHSNLESKELDALFGAVLKLQNVEECYRFFADICSANEIKAIAQRLAVAKFLDDGLTYQEIVQKLGASTATISRVNRSLHFGANGYHIVLRRLQNRDEE
ncbi:MAG: TrpR-like protein YerC/YecD [Clostridiales bacterium]|jgi:TrpR-related protein YerC/YecD|nr:TrpR-like protein YerC/YecD [Clostridiales bacterium]